MTKTTNILLAGVGGQGVLLASEVLSKTALREDYDVKKSEVHGMAQRGGSVVSNVRFGKKVYSPLIAEGEADIILAFEQLEALRWVKYLRPGGIIVTSTQRIDPLPVAVGEIDYPDDVLERLEKMEYDVVSIDALELAREAGNQKAINIVLIGCLSNYIKLSVDGLRQVIQESVPEKTVDINLRAFEAGRTHENILTLN